MKLKKILAGVLSMTMVMSMLAGCAVSTDTGAPAPAPAADTTAAAEPAAESNGDVEEITWMFWDDLNATEDLISLGYKDVVDRFNADYAGKYHVTPITTNLEEYYPKLNALVASNQTPDVFIVSPGPNLDVYVDPGVVAPLDEYLADGWMDSFSSEAVLSGGKYGDSYYAVPLNIAAACVFYNTEMFEKAGVEVPTNWTEFLDVCAKLKDAGITPITISAGTAWCLSMVAGYLCDRNGVDLDKIAAQEAHWTDDNVKKAANQLIELSQYFQPTAASDTNDIATANFYNEEAAILIQGSWAIGQINGANPDFETKCGVFQFPAVEGGNDPNRVIAKSDSLAMSSTTAHPEAAIAFMKYFTDDTAQKYTAEIGGKIPVTKVEYDASKAPAELAYVMDIFSNASGTFGFYNESLASTEAGSFFDDQFVSMYLGQSTVDEGLQAIEDFYKENVW